MTRFLTRVVPAFGIIPWWMGTAWRMDAQLATRCVLLPFHVPAQWARVAWWWIVHPWRRLERFERVAQLRRQRDSLEIKLASSARFHAEDVKQAHAKGWRAGYQNAFDVMDASLSGGSEAGRAAVRRPEDPT